MFQLHGIQLDSTHLIANMEDKEGAHSWWVFEFASEIEDSCVNIEEDCRGQPLWSMYEIDPNGFEWNGKTVRLVIDTED